ncbi:MAG: DEAD/DEAH box helicase family protein [Rhodococcus sp. (in: high G+C Gram-positive bacteria)]|uniref:DEAD/DEAH box helicase n=1 Tax=Rhodococcus sp. TaxID=1831 RepID=UPI003BB56C45
MATTATTATLDRFQQEALEQIRGVFERGHPRATLSMPCGTGKTVVMAALLDDLDDDLGHVVVFVPTVRLLVQTARVLRRARPHARFVAVCGERATDPGDFDAADALVADDVDTAAAARSLGVAVTTDPDALAALLTGTATTLVVSTYASAATVAAATATSAVIWDLLICDEAHRTAGTSDKAWALPVDNDLLPARRRLFATATVRAVSVPTELESPADSDIEPVEVLSMTSVLDYGPAIAPLTLREAITAGRLSDYRIATVAVDEAAALAILEGEADDHRLDPISAAAQLALLRAADTHPDLKSVMVFHNRIDTSRAWAAQFRALAASAGRTVRVFHVDGGSDPRHLTQALNALSDPGDELVVVSNCRVLAEGVDVPALDAVMFAGPRTSTPDIIQIVGRALRRHPQGNHRAAVIIIPVLHRPGDRASTEDRVARTRYLAVWQILTVLAEEDSVIFESLATLRRALDTGAPISESSTRIRFDTSGLPENLVDGFSLAIVRRTTSGWIRVHHALREQALRGNSVDPRPGLVVPDAHSHNGYPLGQRVAALRAAHRAGRVPKQIVALFDNDPVLDGWSWTSSPRPAGLTVETKLDLVERYVTLTRIPQVLASATVDDPASGRRVKIGAWLASLRPSTLTDEQRVRLAHMLPAQFG